MKKYEICQATGKYYCRKLAILSEFAQLAKFLEFLKLASFEVCNKMTGMLLNLYHAQSLLGRKFKFCKSIAKSCIRNAQIVIQFAELTHF